VKLYASPASSFARKIRVMLIEKNVNHELEIVNLWEPNDLKNANPIGKVPALKLDDGRVLISSPLIADYIDSTYPSPRFIPADADARLEVKLREALADGTMMRFHDQATRSQAWLDRQRSKIDGGFAALEKMLGNRRWCVGDEMTLADIAIACHLGFVMLRAPHFFSRDACPNLARLWQTMEARESLTKTAPKP
jgi:glutathione S-transferase